MVKAQRILDLLIEDNYDFLRPSRYDYEDDLKSMNTLEMLIVSNVDPEFFK